ncbi:MAG: hypothetical protein B7Z75_04045 [Acidocella sp. 20-57-95]|nr:MAG: hypothetical protein B7Z75_04045 [Acidocella sp. 20-57-95]OYV56863.1 MAG: hypothetical protein B7Z71_12590 [Acidocella sp. 21-58-7]HQT63898.1 DUF6362 family protein [Acidocella sp.]HQU05421.1 DUF6362 family protein [Acidocella sp.]
MVGDIGRPTAKPFAPCGADEIVDRLEAAGATLLAMPGQGYSTRLRQMRFDVVHTALEAYGWEAPPLRAPVPGSAAISDMDEVFGWLRLIPDGQFMIRRIVGARALVHPITGRHLFAWRRLGALLGADHKSVQRWHGQGVAILVAALCKPG